MSAAINNWVVIKRLINNLGCVITWVEQLLYQEYIIYVDLQNTMLLIYGVLLTTSLTIKFKINASMKQIRVICEARRALCSGMYFPCCLICKQLNVYSHF